MQPALAKATGARSFVLEDRRAPEHPYPAQLEDALAAFAWLRGHGIDAGNTVTAGDSAGGNLAVTLVLALRERGEQLPSAIIGLSPWVTRLVCQLHGRHLDRMPNRGRRDERDRRHRAGRRRTDQIRPADQLWPGSRGRRAHRSPSGASSTSTDRASTYCPTSTRTARTTPGPAATARDVPSSWTPPWRAVARPRPGPLRRPARRRRCQGGPPPCRDRDPRAAGSAPHSRTGPDTGRDDYPSRGCCSRSTARRSRYSSSVTSPRAKRSPNADTAAAFAVGREPR